MRNTLDITVLEQYAEEKRLKRQRHPCIPLYIWNYSERVQFKGLWDHITLQCRALVTDDQGNVVARSFPKFFNANEREANVPSPSLPFTVYEKVDGSLGVLFHYSGKWIFASRGSFVSEQAKKGWDMIKGTYTGLLDRLDPLVAYTFEIIYPDNRIVVDYGKSERLVFLAAFMADGEEVTDSAAAVMAQAGVPVVRQFSYTPGTKLTDLYLDERKNQEGYVVRFSDGHRVKVKFSQYVALHKAIRRVDTQWVLDRYIEAATTPAAAGHDDGPFRSPPDDVLEGLPDEFVPWATTTWATITRKHKDIHAAFNAAFDECKRNATAADGNFKRAIFGRGAMATPFKSAMFARLDGRAYTGHLLKHIQLTDVLGGSRHGGTAVEGLRRDIRK